jgi:23S rRNA pseudouridine1911/1915/1917 synthase
MKPQGVGYSFLTNPKSFVVDTAHWGQRLDVFLAKAGLPISRSRIKQLILRQGVKVNQQPVKPNYRLKADDRVELVLPEPEPDEALPEAIPLDIVYEDPSLIVVNKPPGMVVHPAAGNYHHTLVNALLAHCDSLSGIGGPLRPGIVHRLDKNTSGLLVVAKTDEAHLNLVRQIAQRHINRTYWGLAAGELGLSHGEIEVPIGRHVVDRKKISPFTRRGKPARTSFLVLEHFPGASLLKLKLHTGRTHQIRVHLSHIGHPILGDRVYKGNAKLSIKLDRGQRTITIPRQMLHAKLLGFSHPRSGKYLEFETPLPEDMQEIIAQLRALKDETNS